MGLARFASFSPSWGRWSVWRRANRQMDQHATLFPSVCIVAVIKKRFRQTYWLRVLSVKHFVGKAPWDLIDVPRIIGRSAIPAGMVACLVVAGSLHCDCIGVTAGEDLKSWSDGSCTKQAKWSLRKKLQKFWDERNSRNKRRPA
jgi:hypothetical protein